MTPPADSWMLFCQRERRWSAAVRDALRRARRPALAERVVTTPSPPAARALAAGDAAVLVAVEVTEESAVERLRLLWGLRACPWLVCVAMAPSPGFRDAVRDMLCEAGARLVIGSPRESDAVIDLHDRFAGWHATRRRATDSPEQAARRRLPWQPAPWAVG